MTMLFTKIFYQPILNLLVFLYNTISFHDLGVAIILLTVVIKLILWPLSKKSIKSQKEMQEIQPKINALKKEYANDKQKMSTELMQLYKDHNVNPFSSCLPLLIQIPVLLAVFMVFRNGLSGNLDLVYAFIPKPDQLNPMAFGFLDLAVRNIPLAILAGLAQFWQTKMLMANNKKDEVVKTVTIGADGKEQMVKAEPDMATIMNKQMLYLMPVFTVFIGISLPGGLTFYWLIVTLLTVLQQWITFRVVKK